MSIYDYAKLAVDAVVPILSVAATFVPRSGPTISIRAIPITEKQDAGGQRGHTMMQNRRVFLVAEADFGSVVPTSGDIIALGGVRWRIGEADQIHPAAPMWRLECQRAPD